jgi:glycosyltransferase involved in cell wall biosynthesis
MKILLAHNFYQSSSPSGEDAVFRAEKELLESRAQDQGGGLITFESYNDDIIRYSFIRKATLPFKTIWSRGSYVEIKDIIKQDKPDIAHFHNIFYLISPSVYFACKHAEVPVVQTLHNFRLFCVNGLLMKDGIICEECIGKLPWRGVANACYRNSRLYSVPVAFTESLHKLLGTWRDKVDAYIALTEFSRKKFVDFGLPEKKVFVKPNFLPNPPEPKYSNEGYAVFLGRLSAEKGLNILITAFKTLQSLTTDTLPLKIIGDGPLRKYVEEKIRAEKIHNIESMGRKSLNECMQLLRGARFMVMPSIWYEGFPMAISEAFACGKPVIASRLGAMTELIENGKTGLLFEAGNPEDLASKIEWMIENESACIEMGKNARRVFDEKYTAEKNYKMLMRIYDTVLSAH